MAHTQALTPEVSRGLSWLQSQVQLDGTLANEGTSIATALQNRTEAAQTLKTLSTLPANLADAIAGETEGNTEYLARRVASLALAGRDASALVSALSARQNPDGGFGGGPGYDSNALDTGWALIALKSANAFAPVSPALGYLIFAQAPDGSYSAPGRPDVEATAIAVLAQRLYASEFNNVIATIFRAAGYLLAQQSRAQQWGDSAFLTATAYEAVHDFVPLEPTATAVRGFLVARQGSEGSWDSGDPFSTALALRALLLTRTAPANPTLAIIRGKLIDSQTRLGLNGVTVTLTGPTSPAPVTVSTGSFEFRDLFPGGYALQLSLNQYGTMTFATAVPSGQIVDFGAIALTKNTDATTGTVRGMVTDAGTDLPLAGASVSLASGPFATADAGGNYQISNVAPGNVIVVANKSGYASAPGGGSVLAGGTLIFSPRLLPATQSAAPAIEGAVTDGVTHGPLAGATISITGSTQASATTDTLGHYRIEPLNTGVIAVSVVRAGYRSITATATVAQNTTIQFSPNLFVPSTGVAKFFVVSNQGEQSTNQVFRYEVAGPADTPVLGFTLTDASFDRPCCLAFSATGEMLVVNRGVPAPGNGSISRFLDPGGAPSFKGTITSASFSVPHWAAFRSGEVFVAQRFGDNVLRFKFDGAGNAVPNGAITEGLGNSAPRGVVANPATGELFVTECCGVNEINRYVFSADGTAVRNGVITGGGLNNPHDMAFSAQGELFVANANGNSVSRFVFDAAGNALPNGQITGNGLNGPIGLDFSPWGELFVASFLGVGGISRWLFDAAFNAVPNGSFPTPVTLGDVQFLPSVPGIRGVVLDAVDDQPVAGVAIEVRAGNTLRTLTTSLDGRFEFSGLPAGQAQFSFTLTGYVAQSLGLELSSLTDLDLGAVHLRKSDVAVFAPDLVVQSVDTQQVASDPWSFSLSGALTATIANQGTATTTGGFKVLAFYDANRNNVYDMGVDLLLGEAQTDQTLAVNATVPVSIALAGTLPFRDAPIKVWVDSAQSVVEGNEFNNVSAAECQVTPPPTTINIAPLFGVASANSVLDSAHAPRVAIDGNQLTQWNAGTFGTLTSPKWLVVDLQRSFKVSAIFLKDIIWTSGSPFLGFNNIYNLYVGNDSINWTQVASGTLTESPDPEANSDFIPIPESLSTFRFVKYEVVGGSHWAHIMDLEILTQQQLPPTTVGDLTASVLRLTDLGSGQLRLSVRVGNGGAAPSTATTVAFHDGDPSQGGMLLGSAPVSALQPGQFQDVNLVGALNISGLNDLFAIVDSANQILECREENNRVSGSAKPVMTGSLAVATDASAYGAQVPVRIAATVVNTSTLPATFNAAVRVEDDTGALVVAFPTHAGVTLPGGASTVLSDTWNTGTTLAGGYRAKAELLDDTRQPYAAALALFNITAGTATASAKVTADKLSYFPSETVQVTSRVTNPTQNEPLNNVTVVTTVLNPDGTARFAQSELIPQLVPSALRDFNYAVPLRFASAGNYGGSLSVRDEVGTVLASSTTSFAVGSSAVSGSGLTGTVNATPKPVPFGDAITLNAAVNNLGNADIAALGAKITIVDPAAERVLAEFPVTLTVTRGQSAPLSFTWPANATVGATYVAVLTATVGTATLILAQDAFTVAPPVTRVTGTLAAIPKQVPQGNPVALNLAVMNVGFGAITGLPLSVTVMNLTTQQGMAQFADSANIGLQSTYQKLFSWPATGAVGTSYTATLSATVNGIAQTLAQDSFTIIAPPVQLDVALAKLKQARLLVLLSCKYGGDEKEQSETAKEACVNHRSAFLASYLTSLGMTYRITATEADFQLAFRSGRYNTYWFTGGGLKLANTLTEEVREGTFRGDALIRDGMHDERHGYFDAVAGITYLGKLDPIDQAVNVTGPLFAAGTLATVGRPLTIELTTGQMQAAFPASGDSPAIVTNQYGLGRGIVFAYDLLGTLIAQPSAQLTEVIQAGIGWVAPEPAGVSSARSYTVLRGRVTNVGAMVELKATFTPPAGATVLGTAPAALPDASGRPMWGFTLDSGATKNLDVGVRLPSSTAISTASLAIESVRNGLTSAYGTFDTTLAVESAETIAPRVASELAALAITLASDKLDRDAAVSSIQSASRALAAGEHEQAIGQLITAAERLLKIISVDVSAQRVRVGRLLQEAQVRWFLAQPQ